MLSCTFAWPLFKARRMTYLKNELNWYCIWCHMKWSGKKSLYVSKTWVWVDVDATMADYHFWFFSFKIWNELGFYLKIEFYTKKGLFFSENELGFYLKIEFYAKKACFFRKWVRILFKNWVFSLAGSILPIWIFWDCPQSMLSCTFSALEQNLKFLNSRNESGVIFANSPRFPQETACPISMWVSHFNSVYSSEEVRKTLCLYAHKYLLY